MIHKFSRYLLTLFALLAMTTGAWADDWTNIVKNSDMEGTDVSCFYVKENAKGAGNMYLAHITAGIGKDGSRAIKVQSDGNEVETWDTQFFIRLPYELPAGTKYKLSFDYKANKEAAADFQCANEPGEYIIWYIGQDDTEDFSFSTSWQSFSKEFTVPADADGSNNDGGWKNNFQTIYFSLAMKAKEGGEANEYFIDNVKVEIQNDVLATLTASPVTDPSLMIPYVTISDDQTSASFEMTPFDATLEYELVRDMSVSMPVTVGTGNDGYRIRIKKDEQTGKFVPAEMTPQAMAGLIAVTDDIEEKTLTNVTDYTVSIYALDADDKPTGDAIAFQDLVPGRYVAKATAATGSAYDGTTALSNIFVLYQGYEVTVPAGEYITYYRDEPLKLDDADKESIELYTVSSVTATEAVLSDPFDAAPANTPLLIYNKNTEEAKTILLIPCNEPDLALTVADQFKGTLDAKEFSKDDMEAANYYVCTGKAFAPVKSAGTIAANRCWLEISTAAPSNARKIVHGDATKITNTDRTDLTDGDLYDLNGRKVLNPTKKGIYIKNGKKVVIK